MGFALGLHIRFASPHIMVQAYDHAWVDKYTTEGFMLCDPTISWGIATTGAVRWSAIGFPDPHNVLGQAAEYGLRYGVCISIGPKSSRSIGGFAREDREFTDGEIDALHEEMRHLHDAATPPERLTHAQEEALRLVASGCRYAEAADRLCISESALKARLKSARDRLSARTMAEAVQRARELNLI